MSIIWDLTTNREVNVWNQIMTSQTSRSHLQVLNLIFGAAQLGRRSNDPYQNLSKIVCPRRGVEKRSIPLWTQLDLGFFKMTASGLSWFSSSSSSYYVFEFEFEFEFGSVDFLPMGWKKSYSIPCNFQQPVGPRKSQEWIKPRVWCVQILCWLRNSN